MKIDDTKIKLKFFGGAGTVTGSKTLVEFNHQKIMIDAGLFQGLKNLRQLNRKNSPVHPKSLDSVLLTHAHLDHCGYLPVLVKNGFKGKIHCTRPTKELTSIILKDSAKIQAEDAARASKHGYSTHKNPEPLYTLDDVERTIQHFETHDYAEWVIINPDMKFQFLNNGHILGSALIELKVNDRIIIFSGDIGRSQPLLLYPPKKIKEADYIILESTYGDRIHEIDNVKEDLLRVVKETVNNGGILMIPSFAVERTQELIYLLYQLKTENRLPNIPIYLDSPMGINSTYVYDDYPKWQNLPKVDLNKMYDIVDFVMDYETSKSIVADKRPKIVLAGSGMLEGGRILHYLNHHIENENNTVLFVGFQAVGTRGRAILRGEKEIKFFGEYRQVKCKIESISSMSAHADQQEMLDWLRNFKIAPKKIFLNHGEPHQSDAFRVKISSELNWDVEVPQLNEEFLLE